MGFESFFDCWSRGRYWIGSGKCCEQGVQEYIGIGPSENCPIVVSCLLEVRINWKGA